MTLPDECSKCLKKQVNAKIEYLDVLSSQKKTARLQAIWGPNGSNIHFLHLSADCCQAAIPWERPDLLQAKCGREVPRCKEMGWSWMLRTSHPAITLDHYCSDVRLSWRDEPQMGTSTYYIYTYIMCVCVTHQPTTRQYDRYVSIYKAVKHLASLTVCFTSGYSRLLSTASSYSSMFLYVPIWTKREQIK